MTRIIFCMFMFIMEELIFPVKGFFTEDALEDLFQSKALLEKKNSTEKMDKRKISKPPRVVDIQPRVLKKLKDFRVALIISVC